MAFADVQHGSTVIDAAGAGTTISFTFAGAQNAGDLIVVIIAYATANDATDRFNLPTDTKGNTYQAVANSYVASGTFRQKMFYAQNIAAATAGANVLTATWTNSQDFPDLRVFEFSGVATASAADGGDHGNGTGSSMSAGALVTTNANDLIVGGFYQNDVGVSVGAGFTGFLSSSFLDISEWKSVSGTGTYAVTGTQNSSTTYVGSIAAFKAGAAATVTPPRPTIVNQAVQRAATR